MVYVCTLYSLCGKIISSICFCIIYLYIYGVLRIHGILWLTKHLTLQGCKEKISDWLAENALTIVAMGASIIILQVQSISHTPVSSFFLSL